MRTELGWIALILGVTAASACSEPSCGPDAKKIGATCVRLAPKDAGNDGAKSATGRSRSEGEDGGGLTRDAEPDRSRAGELTGAERSMSEAKVAEVCAGAAGKFVCDGVALLHCDSSGAAMPIGECDSEKHCRVGAKSGECPVCLPDAYRCKGADLEQCARDGSEWSKKMTCASEALCDEAGSCSNGKCTADSYRCSGDELQKCSAELTTYEKVETCEPGFCDATGKQCDTCEPGVAICDGKAARKACDADGQNFASKPCPSGTPVCTGEGQCVECAASSDCSGSSECQVATCQTATGRCMSSNAEAHTKCGAGVCDGAGKCVGCVNDSDCGGNGSTCTGGQCMRCTPGENLIRDPGFEMQVQGQTIAGSWTSAVAKAGTGALAGEGTPGCRAGRCAVVGVAKGWSEIRQTVALKPNTEYELKGWLHYSSTLDTSFVFGVRAEAGSIDSKPSYSVTVSSNNSGVEKSVRFSSGPATTSMTVFARFMADPSTDTIVGSIIDDVSLTRYCPQ
jgi:hypothetical protein